LKKKEITWGILGCGKIAQAFAKGLKTVSGAKLLAAASKTPGKAEKFSAAHDISRVYGNYEHLAQDPDVDVIYVATTHNLHHENTLLALSQGKHVLCEKPFTVNARQAEDLIRTAREKDLFLMEAMWTRFLPGIRRLVRRLAEDIIGEIRSIRADFGRRFEWNPEDRLHNPHLAGGALLDLGIYPVSFSFLLYKKVPIKIKSSAYLGKTGVDEQSHYLFEYDKGESALLSSSFKLDMPNEALILGTHGYIRVPQFYRPKEFTVFKQDQAPKKIKAPFKSTGLQYQAKEVMNKILEGEKESDLMPLEESLEIMKTLDTLRSQWGFKYPGEK
jgi:predicted dehydrogenase